MIYVSLGKFPAMKSYFFSVVLLFNFFGIAQSNTEVFIAELDQTNETIRISNLKNISNDSGYDSQPSFANNELLLFAGNNNGQVDIAQYDLKLNKKSWYHKGSPSGQYSPQMVTATSEVFAVHLDTNGRQRLFRHNGKNKYSEAHPDLQIAYFAMYNEDILVGTVLGDEGLDMIVADLKTKLVDTVFYDAGRSFHKMPAENSMSYTLVNKEGNHDVYQLDMTSFESFFVAQLPIGVQDHIWLSETSLLAASNDKIYLYDLFGDGEWKQVADLSESKIRNITRMAVSPNGTKLALVAEPLILSPVEVVQQQLDAYNERDIDKFAATYAKEVKIYNYPNNFLYEGRDVLYQNYATFFENTPDLYCEIKNRIIIGNKVIDEELVTVNGASFSAVAIYEVENGLISKVTFIQ